MLERVIRAIRAIGIVLKAKDGKIKCLMASPSNDQLPVRMALRMLRRLMKVTTAVWKPWAGIFSPQTCANVGGKTPAVNRPDGGSWNGVFFNRIENIKASISPSQKTGIETPMLAHTMVTTSTHELCRPAEIIPSGIPMMMLRMRAQKDSSMVVGDAQPAIGRPFRCNGKKHQSRHGQFHSRKPRIEPGWAGPDHGGAKNHCKLHPWLFRPARRGKDHPAAGAPMQRLRRGSQTELECCKEYGAGCN